MAVSNPAARPALHWDAAVTERVNLTATKTWTLHVGGSFADVATSNGFYSAIENLFHNGVTAGCGGSSYCPSASVTRAQMAVFLLKSKFGRVYVPPAASGTFADVPPSSFAADWIEDLAASGITAGCGGPNFCPNAPVTRAQMAVFLLKAKHGGAILPARGRRGLRRCPPVQSLRSLDRTSSRPRA